MNVLITTLMRWLSGISSTQWQAALKWVMELDESELPGLAKLQEVLARLSAIGLSGSKANFLVELAVQYAKKKGWIL